MSAAQASPALFEDVSGSTPGRIGRYQILFPIGSGGMATVFVAGAPVVGGTYRLVALKMMHPRFLAGDGGGAAQLLEEAKLAASIHHLNVVAVHEAAEEPRGVYMVMDYVEGDTLSGLARAAAAAGERLPLPIVGRILSDALSGLHAAHELVDSAGRQVNVVHRDCSPSNLLVGLDGVTRLADFGVAKAASRASATVSGEVKGKLGYMAPEQVLGQPLDRRCDVWAAGVVAWECLAGQRLHSPGDSEEGVATLFRIVAEDPPLLATVRSDLPEELGAALATALTRDVASRCPTAAELRRRLLDAWRPLGPLADVNEVAEYVERLAGERLRALRRRAWQTLEQRQTEGASVDVVTASEPMAPAGFPASRVAGRSRLPLVLATGVVLLVASAVATGSLLKRGPSGAASAPVVLAAPDVVEEKPDAAPTPSAAPALPPSPSAPPLAEQPAPPPPRPPSPKRASPRPARPPVLAPSPFGNH